MPTPSWLRLGRGIALPGAVLAVGLVLVRVLAPPVPLLAQAGLSWLPVAGLAVAVMVACVFAVAGAVANENVRLIASVDTKVHELHEARAALRSAVRERDLLAEELRGVAAQDSLTGLANRAMFHDRLAAVLTRRQRRPGQVAVVLLDLDGFKPINDRYGHVAADTVLREAGQRLRRCLRETDTVARLGGDEFAVLLDGALGTSITRVAERIVAAVRQSYVVDGVPMTVGVSVGVAFRPPEGCTVDELLHKADVAMYEAKSHGRNAYAIADSRVTRSVRETRTPLPASY